MKMKRYMSLVVLILTLVYIGYWYLGNTTNTGNTGQSVTPKLKQVDHSPIVIKASEYSKDDQSFLITVKKSVKETAQMISKLEEDIDDAQDNDELMEATDSMTDVKKQILFHWNSIHNGYIPKDESLLRLKARYEAILDNYREGISLELDGMEQVDPSSMKAGFEITSLAKKDLQELLKVVSG